MRSRATERQRLLGVEAADQHRAQSGRARDQHAVEQARDVGHRRRHQHGVGRAEAVDLGHQRGLPAQAPVGVQHRLGDPGRARGEQDEGDVGGLAGDGAGRAPGRRPSALGERRGVRERRRARVSRTRAGSIWPRAASTSAAPNECSTGAATAPMRQQARVRTAAARLLGTCQATAWPAPDAPGPQAAGHRGHQGVGLGGGQPGRAVDHLAAVRGEQGVERRHVPGAARPPVAAGLLGHPGRSEAGRHGRAPYPGPTNVTPMSGRWREPAWISR